MGEKKKKPEGGHQALYRKYRSKSLDEVVGQEHITRTLANVIKHGKISHAYLFTGPKGTGKTSVARILAHEINRLPYTDEQPHLDIIEIDAASNRRIDDIRDLRDKVHIAPVVAKYKVYIIDEVHMLTSESFNALLKTLEEPPEHVVFILATTEVHKLPATIISRTQRHSFKAIPADQVAQHLRYIAGQEKIDISDGALQLLAEHGDGSFRDSISLLDQMSTSQKPIDEKLVELLLGVAPKQQLASLLDATLAGETQAVIQHIEKLIEAGTTPSGIAMQLVQLIRRTLQTESTLAPEMVRLMHDLLAVSSAQYQRLKLEATLLGAAITDQASQPATSQKPAKSQPAAVATHEPMLRAEKVIATPKSPEPLQAPKAKISTKKSSKKNTTKSGQAINLQADWPDILAEIKTNNSPLYTILRLAAPVLENDDTLTLAFGFEFHRKRVDDSKHKAIVAQAVSTVSNAQLTVSTKLDKSLATQTDTPAAAPEIAHASQIASIRDIMGGGEVVNA